MDKRGFTMLHRIITENKNYDQIKKLICDSGINGATLIKADGLWQGKTEHSLIIEIDIANGDNQIESLAFQIKKLNKQDKVLVQQIHCNSVLI